MALISKIIRNSVIGLALITAGAQAGPVLDIHVPITSRHEQRDVYETSLLRFVLEKAGVTYRLHVATEVYSQARVIEELRGDGPINLYWMGTSQRLEEMLLPVRVPIYRGLIGHRVFLINKASRERFAKVRSLEDLQEMRGVQSIGWVDIPILGGAGLYQSEVPFESAFKVVETGRVDYFSRGVVEAYPELAARREAMPNIIVDEHVLLVYPFAMYFFTGKEHPEIAAAIEKGFEKAYEDGSFLAFFYSHPQIHEALSRADLHKRVRIDVDNPFLSPETRALPARYWHSGVAPPAKQQK